tara:strand:+ start:886 stop:1923 length:1038 start_codon:yes stop_codon:yes gene_type:complete
MFDIFLIGDKSEHSSAWKSLSTKFPNARCAESVPEAKKLSLTKFLWIVWPELVIEPDFKFDYEPDMWSGKYTHVFLNDDKYDGIALMPKNSHHGPGEIRARFYIHKKKIDILASKPEGKFFDIVFISYQEPDADENYSRLLERFPRAKRVHGVKGIHQAHIEAAKQCDTDMVWIVDGDAHIMDYFNFSYFPEWHNREAVHVWRSINPINGLVYGYGGVKLFPREATINMDVSKPDMTTSISDKFVAVNKVSNTTAFNTDPFNTWKSAFRECCKLSSKVIDRQKDEETNKRLYAWCTIGEDEPFGKYAIMGAKAGSAFGARHKEDKESLAKINDFDWLKEKFDGSV